MTGVSSLVASVSGTATGASFTAMPVKALVPVNGVATPSLTLVAIEKSPLKFAAGLKVNPASSALTSPTAPEAVQTPATSDDVTEPKEPELNVPAAGFDSVSVTVTLLSTSVTTMLARLSG